MSTRRTPNKAPLATPTGFESPDAVTDIKIPSCTIEDLDRAVFNLFDSQLPLQVKQKDDGVKKVPIIFATGERFAFLRRKVFLGDRGPSHSALILPLISIQRSNISQEPENGALPGQTLPITIKRRLSKDNPIYKRLVNEMGFQNQDDLATSGHNLSPAGSGATPGTVGTRRSQNVSPDAIQGKFLKPQFANNIYETLTIPPAKHYTATYDISIWAQYTQEMNEMLMTIMSLYQNNDRRTFRLESPKGYWFVGYVASDLSADINTDDFTDQERVIRYNLSIKANGYIIAPEYPGSPAYIRRYVSAPSVNFGIFDTSAAVLVGNPSPQDANPNSFLLEEVYSETNDIVDSRVGGNSSRDLSDSLDKHVDSGESTVGKYARASRPNQRVLVTRKDIFTGQERNGLLRIRSTGARSGETVYREQIVKKLDDI